MIVYQQNFSYDEETPSNSHLYLAATEREADEGTDRAEETDEGDESHDTEAQHEDANERGTSNEDWWQRRGWRWGFLQVRDLDKKIKVSREFTTYSACRMKTKSTFELFDKCFAPVRIVCLRFMRVKTSVHGTHPLMVRTTIMSGDSGIVGCFLV